MLTVSNLRRSFGSQVVFDGASWAVGERDRVALVGANGSGKSTLLRMIAGLEEADDGVISLPKGSTVGYLPQDGLETAGRTFHQSLAEFDYFQFMTLNGRKVDLEAPERLIVTFEDGQMLILFESRPKAPVKLQGTIDVGVYDPTFYIAMDFAEDTQLSATGLPAGCRQAVLRPDEDELLAKGALTEDFFENPGATDIGKAFATYWPPQKIGPL